MAADRERLGLLSGGSGATGSTKNLDLPAWLFASYRNHGGLSPSHSTLTTRDGTVYSSGNTYKIMAREADGYISVPLNSNYSTLTGTLNLLSYFNGDETLYFVIAGDGTTLYEQSFKAVDYGTLTLEDYAPVTLSLDVSGVDVLTIQFYGSNDSKTTLLGMVAGNSTISDMGMIDFLLHH